MTRTITIGPFTYTWQGGKYADVKYTDEANAFDVVEVPGRTDNGFFAAAFDHASDNDPANNAEARHFASLEDAADGYADLDDRFEAFA
jgi:hypothetical protein